jgi:hypothetical protein
VNSGSACYHSVQNILSSYTVPKNIKLQIYKTTISHVVLYRHMRSLTLKEEHRLAVFKNRVLRRMFGPKSEEAMGGWRKLYKEELHNFYTSQNITVIKSWRMKSEEHVACIKERRNLCKILVRKPEERRLYGKLMHTYEYNIKMDLRETDCGAVDWIHLVKDRVQW